MALRFFLPPSYETRDGQWREGVPSSSLGWERPRGLCLGHESEFEVHMPFMQASYPVQEGILQI